MITMIMINHSEIGVVHQLSSPKKKGHHLAKEVDDLPFCPIAFTGPKSIKGWDCTDHPLMDSVHATKHFPITCIIASKSASFVDT